MQTKTIKIRNIKGRVEDNILSKTGMAVSVSHGMAGISRQMAYTYDAIGRLTGKRRQLTGTGVSTCQYAYDVHGWPRSVKEGEFRQQLYYADGLDGGCWNGNISTVKWKTDGNSSWQGYNLRYDGAGRLQGAVFGSGDNLTSYRGYFSESAEYDSGGNVTGLRRRGLTDNLHGGFSYVDRLCMTYEGNRLVSVRDSASRLPYANATDFDGVTGREYALAYNGAGALVSDEGRGMARVDYDLMGNPARIQFTDGSVTRYIYSATGEKLRVVHLTAVPNITVAMGQTRELVPSEILSADSTDYLLGGTLTMRDGRIDRYLFDEGYCQAMPSAINASQDGNSDGDVQPVRFSGKELDRMHGLGTYDFGARQYNPVTMRWDRMDPMCEKTYGMSPYAYCNGNPINLIDPDGQIVDDIYYNEDGNELYRVKKDGPDNYYVIKTTKKTNEIYTESASPKQKGWSNPISKEDAFTTELKIMNGDITGKHMENVTYLGNSNQINGMLNSIKDDGKGGTSPNNNREYSGNLNSDGVKDIKQGSVGDPSKGQHLKSLGNPDYHSHPSGTKPTNKIGYSHAWQQGPSPQDIKTAKGNEFVIGMGSGIIYKYNKNGVFATITIKTFK